MRRVIERKKESRNTQALVKRLGFCTRKKVLKIAQCLSLAQVYLEDFFVEISHTLGDGRQSYVSL